MLFKFNGSNFYSTGDIWILKLFILLTLSCSKLSHFDDFGQIKIDPTCLFLLTLAR